MLRSMMVCRGVSAVAAILVGVVFTPCGWAANQTQHSNGDRVEQAATLSSVAAALRFWRCRAADAALVRGRKVRRQMGARRRPDQRAARLQPSRGEQFSARVSKPRSVGHRSGGHAELASLAGRMPAAGLTTAELNSLTPSQQSVLSTRRSPLHDRRLRLQSPFSRHGRRSTARSTSSRRSTLPGIVDWVMTGSGTAKNHIRQISDPLFRVTGGAMYEIDGRTHLVFGQDFSRQLQRPTRTAPTRIRSAASTSSTTARRCRSPTRRRRRPTPTTAAAT